MKKIKNIYKIILIFLVVLSLFSVNCFAEDSMMQEIVGKMDPNSSDNADIDPTENSKLLGIVSQVFTVIQFVGTGISIIMVMWLGITYMITSVEQKAEIKKRMVPIVIGSVLIVSSVNILKLIQIVVTNSLDDSTETNT